MRVVSELAKAYRKGDPLSTKDLLPRVVNRQSTAEVRALFLYVEGLHISGRDAHLVPRLAERRTRLLLAALYEHPGLPDRPKSAKQWLAAVESLLTARAQAAQEAEELDRLMQLRGRNHQQSMWRLGRSPSSYDR